MTHSFILWIFGFLAGLKTAYGNQELVFVSLRVCRDWQIPHGLELFVSFPDAPQQKPEPWTPVAHDGDRWLTATMGVPFLPIGRIHIKPQEGQNLCIDKLLLADKYHEATTADTTDLPFVLSHSCEAVLSDHQGHADVSCAKHTTFIFPKYADPAAYQKAAGEEKGEEELARPSATTAIGTTVTTSTVTRRITTLSTSTTNLADKPSTSISPTAAIPTLPELRPTYTSTTTTTITTTVRIPVPPLDTSEVLGESALPTVFVDEFEARLVLGVPSKYVLCHPLITRHYKLSLEDVLHDYLSISKISETEVLVTFVPIPTDASNVVAIIDFLVPRRSSHKAQVLRDKMDLDSHPENKARLNALLADIPPFVAPAVWPPPALADSAIQVGGQSGARHPPMMRKLQTSEYGNVGGDAAAGEEKAVPKYHVTYDEYRSPHETTTQDPEWDMASDTWDYDEDEGDFVGFLKTVPNRAEYLAPLPVFHQDVVGLTCVEAVVYAIITNGNLLRGYKYNFVFAMALVCSILLVAIRTKRRLSSGPLREQGRGKLVVPLFVIAVFFQSVSIAAKAVDKYNVLVTKCSKQVGEYNRDGEPLTIAAANCPPSQASLIFELVVIGGMTFVFCAIFVGCVWLPHWAKDCDLPLTSALDSMYIRIPKTHTFQLDDLVVASNPRLTRPRPSFEGDPKDLIPKLLEKKDSSPAASPTSVGSRKSRHSRTPKILEDAEILEPLRAKSKTPSVGEKVEVTHTSGWIVGQLVEDRRSRENRWVVKLDNGNSIDVAAIRRAAMTDTEDDDSLDDSYEEENDFARRRLLHQYHLTPLQSVMRRGQVLAWMEVEAWDHMSATEHWYLCGLDLAISYSTVLTSFFLLQRYEFPGTLTAWSPYKLIFELLISSVIRYGFRMVAEMYLTGNIQKWFTITVFWCFILYDVAIWYMVSASLYSLNSQIQVGMLMSILDITVGAGIITFLLGRLSITFGLLLFSAYVYEPYWRHRWRRAVVLTSSLQVLELCELLQELKEEQAVSSRNKRGWEVGGDPVVLNPNLKAGRQELPWAALMPNDRPECELTFAQFLALRQGHKAGEEEDEELLTKDGEALCSPDDLELASQMSTVSPVALEVRRSGSFKLTHALITLLDLIFSVDPQIPVAPLLQPRM
eukprot:CAMPEP_0206587290 /NCGR_PEP_ID=MMETSP0325_2-20121206/37561_1 /ASSEMBLY_ACC=CAM_ASM_000347 /TAXON_ID=2866 /ORGANISM="Crypthecodinium cohnii, Strain Seligo" /LENGTH=1145 /DNA_ID=CAMNT_0054095273 /DNA_START=72 /DNA_END=3509 /DNA_ORIENTATION=+